MSMIFPGMDPYLESSSIWQGFHNALVVYIRDQLQPALRPRYIAAIEDRVLIEEPKQSLIPVVSIHHQSYIEILDRQSEQRVVTVIEVLSPTNKFPGPGRDAYLAKTKELRSSTTHLVEIDLLRRGDNTIGAYPRLLREPLPRIRVPLADGDADVVLDVQAVVAQTYDAGSYIDRLRYDRRCLPALSEDDQAWANDCIRKAMAQ